MIRYALFAAFAVASGGAAAADLPSRKTTPPPASTSCLETSGLPTDVFGFNVGSDVNDHGALSASAQYNGAYGARFGSFAGHTGAIQLSYGLFPCVEIGPFLTGATLSNGGVIGLGAGSALGGGVEFKYKFLGRGAHGVGLTADLILQGQGLSGNFFAPSGAMYDAIASLFLDAEIAPGRLFFGANISYDFNFLDRVAPGGVASTSVLRLGAALSYQIVDGFFVGADVNHYRRFGNSFFGAELGHATFVGPNFYWQATPKLAFTAAYNVQVDGRATFAGAPPGNLDLSNFNQHLLKVKLAYSF